MHIPSMYGLYANISQAKILFDMKNHPDSISLSRTKRDVQWEEHLNWMKMFLSNPNNFLFLVMSIDPMGYIRVEEKHPDTYELSWFLYPDFRGQGHMTNALQMIFEDYPDRHFFATIHKDNIPSRKLAEKFFNKYSGDDWLVYRN
jgi:RimJ/RimL family protein N-acetyltransferase